MTLKGLGGPGVVGGAICVGRDVAKNDTARAAVLFATQATGSGAPGVRVTKLDSAGSAFFFTVAPVWVEPAAMARVKCVSLVIDASMPVTFPTLTASPTTRSVRKLVPTPVTVVAPLVTDAVPLRLSVNGV